MYEKPELTLVGNAAAIVLGDRNENDDNDAMTQEPPAGLVQGLDD